MNPPLLRLTGIEMRYRNGTRALDQIGFDLSPAGFVALVGPSGCGKSSLLRIIAGLMRPSAGTLHWHGGQPARLGFVFQDPTLLPWARVRDNIRLPLRLAGRIDAAAERRIDGLLDLVGLAGFARAYPRELSGGMKMRVSIARALATEPDLLLMDEPFAALDEPTRFKLNDDLHQLWAARGIGCVFVTHSIYESVYLAQRVLVMRPRPGRIIADLPIDLPARRHPALRHDPAYAAQCRHVSAALAAAEPAHG